MRADHAGRRERLRGLLAQRGPHGALVVTDLANIRYLTGFSGSNAVLVVGTAADQDVLGTDGRYQDQVRDEAPDLSTVIDRDTLAATLRAGGWRSVAVEGSLGVGVVEGLRREGVEAEVAPALVQELRRVKDEGEIALLARACAITAEAFAILASEIGVGMTELQVARRLEQVFGELGAEDRAFESIVASGAAGALPHHQPGSGRLERGDLLVIDAGARVEGYHADMTRTYLVGADPQPWQAEIHALVRDAQASAAAAYRPGADCRALHQRARSVIDAGGYGEALTHGIGHGVGLDIHEAPMIGPRATGTIEADMAITVEPGIYLLGRGGVRIEDTLVVTDNGPSTLTEAPRDLVVVG